MGMRGLFACAAVAAAISLGGCVYDPYPGYYGGGYYGGGGPYYGGGVVAYGTTYGGGWYGHRRPYGWHDGGRWRGYDYPGRD